MSWKRIAGSGKRIAESGKRIARRWRVLAAGVCVLIVASGIWVRLGPLPAGLLDGVDTPSTVVVDRRGRVLFEALSSSGSRIEPFAAGALPPALVDATLAAEDRRFYSHPGVDVIALARALRQNLAERQIAEGGSTITQQVAKLLLQRREGIRPRGFRAKARETVLALRLEHRFDKREILALYLNLASYGNQATGAGRASQIYFGVDASMLTPSQAAFLAALPQRPTAFNPWKNLASAQRRQQTVLARMAAAGRLSDERLREARAERIALRPRHTAFNAPHFVGMVSTFAKATVDKTAVANARIVTTLDLDLQREVERIVEHERPSLKAHGAANAAVVVLDNATGEWLAWEGSGNYGEADGGAINGPLVPRQPGSALKPFTYALAFEQGQGPASVLPDIATHFPTAEPGVLYSPRNYDGRYHGPMLARRALAGSQNIPAVALTSDLGVSPLLRFLLRAGLSTLDRPPAYYGVGLTLGNAEVRLDELVAAYAAFARGGVWKQPRFLREGEMSGVGSSSLQAGDLERPLVSPETAFLITDILSDPRAREQAFGRGSDLDFPFAVAVKTGTSQAYHDNWTIGYTRDVTVGVWVGNFARTPLRNSSGVTGAGPIFHAVMLAATRGRESAGAHAIHPVPDGLEQTTICTLSGMRANRWCPSRAPEWSAKRMDPLPCSWHHLNDGELLTIYPPEYRAWAAEAAPPAPSAPPAQAPLAPLAPPAPPAPSVALLIANPPAGAIYSLDPTLRREFQALPLRAVTQRPTTVTWRVNGAMIGSAPSERAVAWPLAVGTHEIEVRDADGRLARTSVVVR